MNQTFDFQRFLLITRLEIAEKGRTQLLMASVLVGVLLLMMLPVLFSDKYDDTSIGLQSGALVLLILFGGSLYTNQVFGQYNSANSAISALMVPASRLEKFLSTLFLNLAFIIPFILLFFGLYYWTIEYANNHLLPGEGKYRTMSKSMLSLYISMIIIVQGVAFFGAVFFTKSSYVKTAIASLILIVFGTASNYYIAKSMAPTSSLLTANPFSKWLIRFNKAEMYHQIDPSEMVQKMIVLLPILILLSLWYIAYVRLVEKEV